jgi:aminomuconate-semialdehyde/2-hydroxymuconate-6-semialdehyde dehydrogenase
MDTIQNYIGGEFAPPASGAHLDSDNPATGEAYARVPDSDGRDVGRAAEAAARAFPGWSRTPAEERCRILLRVAEAIERELPRLALAESVDSGKPMALARTVDIPRAALNFRFFATAILHFASEAHAMGETALNYTLRDPIGVAGCISPWNLPLYLFTWKVAPALAAGNCVVAKPSELTPMTAHQLARLCAAAGLPPGVLNIVHGYGHKVGAAVTAHPGIPVLTFTGGTKTGAEIAKTAAPLFKKVALEMGGKNPTVVFADADFGDAVATSVRSAFSNQGEICLCGSRVFVERPLYARFRDAFVERARALTVGDPLREETQIGALISRPHMEKVLGYIALAKEEGGTVLCGGQQVRPEGRCKNGWFVAPAVIEGLPHDCRTNREEIFGPVVTLMPFDAEDEAVRYADSTPYGLAAIVWTRDLSRAHRVASRLHSGVVWVNCWMLRDLRTPFGGTKQSGLGKEGGLEALRFFTEPKNVCIKL